MTYNCMLGAFTKPGLNLMGNDDLIFDSDDDYNGPALWKTSTYSFIVYLMMGCYVILNRGFKDMRCGIYLHLLLFFIYGNM